MSAATSMRVYCHVMHVPTAQLVPIARRAEELGFDGIALSDHVVFPVDRAEFQARIEKHWNPMGKESGRAEFPKDRGAYEPATEFPDPWVAIAAMATATTRLDFMTTVYLLPLRHPLTVAQQVATAAVLSDNRVTVGVGAGWFESEFQELDVPYGDRGGRLTEQIAILRKIWAGGPVEHRGKRYDFGVQVHQTPPRPPKILVGGRSPAALRRAGGYGDGYIAPRVSVEEFSDLKRGVEEALAKAGRSNVPFEYVMLVYHEDAFDREAFSRLQALGCNTIRVAPFDIYDLPWGEGASLQQRLDALERYADEMATLLPGRVA